MLALAFVLGTSFVFFLIRECWSETYRCHYCSKIQVGSYHRLRCLILSDSPSHAVARREVPRHG
jgi:hypothetical protein